MRAERDLRVGRDQTTLWSVLGYRVVHLSADPTNWPISRLRPGSAVLTPAPQPGVLARSSGLGCLVRGVRSLPQPPGSRVAWKASVEDHECFKAGPRWRRGSLSVDVAERGAWPWLTEPSGERGTTLLQSKVIYTTPSSQENRIATGNGLLCTWCQRVNVH